MKHKFIALLRGINVGGKRKILMADLKMMFEAMGFGNVHTYIQSGNVIFDAASNVQQHDLAQAIQENILKKFGHEVPVIVISSKELAAAIQQNPFYNNKANINQLHLTFLNEQSSIEKLEKINTNDKEVDQFKILDKNIFIQCAGKYHLSKYSNHFFEKKLDVKATTRNWKTVLKLMELCG